MSASSRRLAKALADRLNPVVPGGIAVEARGADVVVVSASGACRVSAAAAIVDDQDGRSLSEKIRTAVWQVLSGVQDCVVHELGARWPEASGGPTLPLPAVQVDREAVRLWYGPEDNPALELAAIALEDLA